MKKFYPRKKMLWMLITVVPGFVLGIIGPMVDMSAQGIFVILLISFVALTFHTVNSSSSIIFTDNTIIYKETLFSRKKSFLISDVEKIWLGFRTHGSAGGHGGYIDVVKFFVKDSNKVYTVWLTPALLKYLIALFPKEKIKVKMVYLTKKYKKILLESGVLSDKKMKEIKHL